MKSIITNSAAYTSSDFFLFLMVLISIVQAKSVGKIVDGYAAVIRNRKNIIHSATLYIWMLCALIVNIQGWWVWWDLREMPFSFYSYLFGFISTMFLLFFSAIIVPDFSAQDVSDQMLSTGKYDLRGYYFRNSAWFSFSAVVLIIVLALWNLFSREYMSTSISIESNFNDKLTYRAFFLALLAVTGLSGIFMKKLYPEEKHLPQPWGRIHLLCSFVFLGFLLVFVAQFTS